MNNNKQFNKKEIIGMYETLRKIINKELTGTKKEMALRFNEVFKAYHLGELKNKSKEYLEFLENEYFPHFLKRINRGINLDKLN